MARKKRPSSYAVDTLKEALQEEPVKQAIGRTRSGSYKRFQNLRAELEEYKASDIAEELGITTQKYIALREEVHAYERSTGVLNDLLEQTLERLQSRIETIDVEVPVYDPIERRTYRQHIETTLEPEDQFEEEYPDANLVKQYRHKASAVNYLARMPGALEYFKITRQGTGKKAYYQIYDIRDPSEQGHRKSHHKTKRQR